ncbi:MAG: YgiQ family radical SAM protein [Clostridia bacterium]
MFLPVCRDDLVKRNINELDFVVITGEAYIDHPSFGTAVISRFIESLGFSIGVIPQPMNDEDFKVLGKPKYAFLINSGVIDSIVNNYTVSKNKRKKDVYSDNGVYGKRPDYAINYYTNKIKKIYPDSFCIIGGVEASLRRFAHYDYFKDCILPSILETSNADLLIYGMGEKPYKKICDNLNKNIPIHKMHDIPSTCYLDNNIDKIKDYELLPSYEDISNDKIKYINAHKSVLNNNDNIYGKKCIQKGIKSYIIQNVVCQPLTTKELDYIYDLPYERTFHSMYKYVPAIEEVEFSITSHRGCFGGCNYCSITYNQGRKIQKRSHTSILKEVDILVNKSNFKGYIHDVGGPTANFREPSCDKQLMCGVCKDRNCMVPVCKNLKVDHSDYFCLLRKIRENKKIKKVFIRSGIRYDYMLLDDEKYLEELCLNHISGQLKVAPEHIDDKVLKLMGKPKFEVYEKFKLKFDAINKKNNMKQYLVPYLISSHPGSTIKSAIKLSEYLNKISYMPEQVQDFYPTPGTISTAMYYTEMDFDYNKIYVAKSFSDKLKQRVMLQYRKKENYDIVKKVLIENNRLDLIGFDSKCLIKPNKNDVYKINELKKENKNNFKRKTIRKIHKKVVK